MRSIIITVLMIVGSLIAIQTTAAVLEDHARRTVHYETVGDVAVARR
jgi:hypothetical protein